MVKQGRHGLPEQIQTLGFAQARGWVLGSFAGNGY
jgi:hypothetical protein